MGKSVISKVVPRAYHDSVRLMQVSKELSNLDSVQRTFVAMGTDSNKRVLEQIGLLTDAVKDAGANDLIFVVEAKSKAIGENALAKAKILLSESGKETVNKNNKERLPQSFGQAYKVFQDANMLFVSVPGPYAALEAAKALNMNMNVMLFSDNVSLEDELVVKNDSKIKKFSDIKGKVLSLNTIGSTSGDLIPQVELAKINLSTTNKDHFKNVFYAGSHDACLLAVLNNQSDVCGMSSRNFEARLVDNTFKIEQVRIIHKSDPVPPPPLAYSKKIPLEDRKKIKKAVLEAHKHGEIGGYGGKMSHYISVKDADYDVLRKVVELLKNK